MKKKHILIIVCILSVFLSMAFVYAADEDEGSDENATSGICGKDVTWVLDDEGTLTIEGTGPMDYTRPWMDERGRCDDLKNIVIKGSVTVITETAFYGCVNLESVELNKGLQTIEEDVFFNCRNLTDVVLPDGLQDIGDRAFGNCESLVEITIPVGVNRDATNDSTYNDLNGPFIGSGLERIHFTDGETVVSAGICVGCDNLTYAELPDSLTRINERAFMGCKKLQDVVLPDSLEYVGTQAFGACNEIKKINIPAGLNSGYEVRKPFEYSGIEKITFGDNTTEIAPYLFEACDSLNKIEIPKGVKKIGDGAFSFTFNVREIIFNTELETVGKEAFLRCGDRVREGMGITSLIIPNNLKKAGEDAFRMDSLEEVTVHRDFNQGQSAAVFAGLNSCNIKKIIIEDGTTNIPDRLFENCNKVEEIVFPESVKTIGKYSFGYCENLTSVSLPSNLEEIDTSGFYYCTRLEHITLPSSIKRLGGSAFRDCNSLTSINIPVSLENASRSFGSRLESVEFESGITKIPNGLLSGCGIKEITIPDSVTEIGDSAFLGCKELENINLGTGLKAIGKSAFSYCTSIENITLPRSLENMGNRCFEYCDNLKKIKIPQLKTSLYPFAKSSIVEVEFYDDVETLPEYLLGNAEKLEKITWPENIKIIDHRAFCYCTSLKSITIPEGVKYIGGSAFEGCSSLTMISFPESVESFGQNPIRNCDNVSTVILKCSPSCLDSKMLNVYFESYSGDIYFTKTEPYWDRDTRLKVAPNASWRNKDCVVLDASYKTVVSEDGTKADTSLTSKDTAYTITEILNDEPEEVEVKAIGKSESDITETTIEIPRDIVAAAVKTGCSFTYTTNTGRVNIDKASVKGALKADTARVKFELDNTLNEDNLSYTYDAKLYNINVAEEEVQVEELDGIATVGVKTPAAAKKGYVVDVYALDSEGSETFICDTVVDDEELSFEMASVRPFRISAIDLKNATLTASPGSFTYSGEARTFSKIVVKIGKKTIADSKLKKVYTNNKNTGNKTAKLKVTAKSGVRIEGYITHKFTIKIAKASKPTVTVGVKKMTIKMSKGVSSTGGTKYVYQYRKSGSSKWKTASKTTKSSVTVRKLKSGKRYQVRVCAVKSGCADGNYSTTVTSGKIRK